jgi:hypothetical protein
MANSAVAASNPAIKGLALRTGSKYGEIVRQIELQLGSDEVSDFIASEELANSGLFCRRPASTLTLIGPTQRAN